MGGGGLVVSPIQFVASSQGFKVIGQPNGVTTIELSTPHSKRISETFKKLQTISFCLQLMGIRRARFSKGRITWPLIHSLEICKSCWWMAWPLRHRPTSVQLAFQRLPNTEQTETDSHRAVLNWTFCQPTAHRTALFIATRESWRSSKVRKITFGRVLWFLIRLFIRRQQY